MRIAEALLSTTEAYDCGNKLVAHRALSAQQEYVLGAIEARRIEVFRRAVAEVFEGVKAQ